MIKKIISFCVLGGLVTNAFADIHTLTKEEALEICPLQKATFVSRDWDTKPYPTHAGFVEAYRHGIEFSSSVPVIAPKETEYNPLTHEVNIQLGTVNGYGHISGRNTVCFYYYPGRTTIVNLIMSGFKPE